MTLRAAARLLWFAWEATVISLDYLLTAAWAPQSEKRRAQAVWLHRATRRHLRIFGYAADVSGPIPQSGLLVANHLSYLDILALAAITPAVFVSKAEVRHWPLFGQFARMAGTVFIHRERRTHVGQVNREIESALDEGLLVVIFPEGTSSDGRSLLPFRAPLLEPALRGGHPIATCWLQYSLEDGDAREEACYWGDHVFFRHVLNLIGKRRIHATVRFGKFQSQTTERKELARQLHAAVLSLKPEK